MKYISLLTINELSDWLNSVGQPSFRGKQIFSWIYDKWIDDPVDMKNIPADLRKRLAEDFLTASSTVIRDEAAGDMTDKLLIALGDEECVETVIIRTDERVTFCLSSQVGCPVRCRFCASGINGLVRNLSAGEIIEHLLICTRKAACRPDNIVFMGIGEPLMNIDNVIDALDAITSPEKFGMSPRRITLSTSGWVPGIKKLADVKKPYNLALSLHATSDAVRSRLIPDKCRYPLNDILDACSEYRTKSGRMITFEYTLIKGVNDSIDDANSLANLAKKHRAKVNLIPFNPVESSGFEAPLRERIVEFLNILKNRSVQATCRMKKGDNINAACGQLRHSEKKELTTDEH